MTRSFLAALAGLAFLIASPAFATNVQTPNLLKGATVWFVEDHTVPMIAMEVSLPAGSAYDPANKDGLASFAGSMLDEGAGGLDSRAFHNALADRAINLSVTTERDYLQITLVTETANAAAAFHLLGLALQRPRFDGDAVTRVRAQMLQNIDEENGDPQNAATKVFNAIFFSKTPYAHAKDGDPPGLRAIGAGDLKAFVRGHWVRGGMKIAISGDVTAQALASLLASAFAGLPGSPPPPPPPVPHPGRPNAQLVPMDVPQSSVVFGMPAIARSDRDYIPAYVANYIVGGGDAARLMEEIRVKRGLTYDASSDLVSYRRAALIEGTLATRRESIDQSIKALRDVFHEFASEGATAQELADAKTYLTGSFPLSFASNAGTASQLAEFQRQGLPASYVAARNGMIDAVTLDDIKRVAARLFDPSHMTIVIAGEPAAKH
jgi:zinc protease